MYKNIDELNNEGARKETTKSRCIGCKMKYIKIQGVERRRGKPKTMDIKIYFLPKTKTCA